MKKINISTKMYPDTFLVVDDEDYDWVKFFKWTPEKRNNGFYARRSYRNTLGKKCVVRIHRDIARARSFEVVDHVNGNGLDNTRLNVRICNNVQNQQNRKKQIKKKGSKYKGVFPRINKKSKTWFVHITINKKVFYLGTFESEEKAAMEYDSKALYYFGNYARINFPSKVISPTPIKGYEHWKNFLEK